MQLWSDEHNGRALVWLVDEPLALPPHPTCATDSG